MKVLNIFLSILILLLAVASAVFSFFLYEKRGQLVDGWEKMARTINSSAVNLDKGSGTEVAKVLSVEGLGHDKFADLDSKLPKLPEHAGKVIAERDDMAAAIKRIAETVEMDDVKDLPAFQGLGSYKTNTNAVVSKVESVTRRQKDTLEQVCRIANKLKADLTVNGLRGSNYSNELSKFDKRVSFTKSRISDADRQFKNIFSAAGGSSRLDFSDSSYKSATGDVVNAVRALKRKFIQANDTIRTRDASVAELQNTIKSKDGHIAGLNKTIKKNILEIKRLERIITGDRGGVAIKPWANGSTEARRAVQGKIIKVDRKYGFVVIDLGTGTTVKQKIGKKMNYPNPLIPVNAKMVVARNIESSDGEFIGEIKLIKIHEDCSIANVISTVKGKGVAVGDTVFFSSAQIAAISKK